MNWWHARIVVAAIMMLYIMADQSLYQGLQWRKGPDGNFPVRNAVVLWGDQSELSQLAQQLTAGDRSVLRASLQLPNQEAIMMTAEGSANDNLWKAMASAGWLIEVPVPDALAGLPKLKQYSLTVAGRDQIPKLLPQAISP
jgi:hypothetical protein